MRHSLANGCFWGSEKGFWRLPGGGIYSTAVGYCAGFTPNPTYEEVCSGQTGHTEAVQVVYDPAKISLADILRWFWQSHDPTAGMGQGNDFGTQYRSGVFYADDEQRQLIEASRAAYGEALAAAGHTKPITTEVAPAGAFYNAEPYHRERGAAHNGAQQSAHAPPLVTPSAAPRVPCTPLITVRTAPRVHASLRRAIPGQAGRAAVLLRTAAQRFASG
eukprot:3871514-Prymnesium_polylepis.1